MTSFNPFLMQRSGVPDFRLSSALQLAAQGSFLPASVSAYHRAAAAAAAAAAAGLTPSESSRGPAAAPPDMFLPGPPPLPFAAGRDPTTGGVATGGVRGVDGRHRDVDGCGGGRRRRHGWQRGGRRRRRRPRRARRSRRGTGVEGALGKVPRHGHGNGHHQVGQVRSAYVSSFL